METWDIFLTDQLEVRRGLATSEVHAALARGEIRDDDLIRPAGSSDPWAPIVDRLPAAASVAAAAAPPPPPVPAAPVEPVTPPVVRSSPPVAEGSEAPRASFEKQTTESVGEILGLKAPVDSTIKPAHQIDEPQKAEKSGEARLEAAEPPAAASQSSAASVAPPQKPEPPAAPPQTPAPPVALFADDDEEDEEADDDDEAEDFPSVEMLEKEDERRSSPPSPADDPGGRFTHGDTERIARDLSTGRRDRRVDANSDGYGDDPLPAGLRAELGRDDLRAESETVVLGVGGGLAPATEWDHSTKAEIGDMALGEHASDVDDDLSLSRGGTEKVEELDLAAMVDVAMQLVLFFLVTGLTVMFKTMEVPKPNPDKPAGGVSQGQGRTLDDLMHDYILVEMDSEGSIKVDQEPVAANFDALVERLRTARESSGGRNTMLLNVDYNTPHRDAVMAYDAANEIGLSVAVGQPSQESSGAPPPAPAAPKGGM